MTLGDEAVAGSISCTQQQGAMERGRKGFLEGRIRRQEVLFAQCTSREMSNASEEGQPEESRAARKHCRKE